MYYLLLLLAVVGIAATFGMGKVYQLHTKPTFGVILRKTLPLTVLEGLMFLAMNGFRVECNDFTLLMAALCTLVGILCAVVCFVGYANGSIAVFTMFQMVGGMLLPFIYGIWYGNEVTVFRVAGIVLLLFSVCLPFFGQRGTSGAVGKLTPKFILLCVSIFFLNGGISIISYIYSNSPSATDTNSFLIVKSGVMAAACVLLLVGYAFTPKGRGDTVPQVDRKTLGLLALLLLGMAVADGGSYYLQLISASKLPAVALYPIVTGGTMVMTALVGRIFFREKISRQSAIGIALAFVATFLFMF